MSDIIGHNEPLVKIACNTCDYKRKNVKCKAFPDRIPNEILEGKNMHTKPLPNQGNDIVYKPIKE
jgi:hypothetical protein